jgi:hypothetical protein
MQLVAAERARLVALVAGLLVACDPLLVFASGSGMEVSLTAALTIWTLVLVQRMAAVTSPAAIGGGLVLGAASVWARPESLFLIAVYALLHWSATRRRVALWPLLGALLALGLWVVYCQIVSGHPLPNTYYAKRHADLGAGVVYFGLRVLTAQAWSVALSGLVLVGYALVRPGLARALTLAWLVSVIAIAGSRELLPAVLFYCSRYFAIFAAIPCVLVASQLPERLVWRALVLLPIAAVNVIMLPSTRELQRAQEQDITTLHTEPAHFMAATLPEGARLLAEGAGAARFFLPRSVWVIDMVGLNFERAVHARTKQERLCAVISARPTHLLLPDVFINQYDAALLLEPLRTFVDQSYALTARSRRAHYLFAARVIEVKQQTRDACRL